jgi:hypothetical protein
MVVLEFRLSQLNAGGHAPVLNLAEIDVQAEQLLPRDSDYL